jgi:hypothetical protein
MTKKCVCQKIGKIERVLEVWEIGNIICGEILVLQDGSKKLVRQHDTQPKLIEATLRDEPQS